MGRARGRRLRAPRSDRCSSRYCLPPRSGSPFVLEAVDVVLGVLDRRLWRVPGKADLQRRERMAVDHHGPGIRPPDPRVPLPATHLEGLDVVLVINLRHRLTLYWGGGAEHGLRQG